MSSPVYSPSFLKSIERTITRERLKRYLRATGQDLPKALALYEQNVALSEALYGLLHWLEVAVRNAANDALSAGYTTPAWYDHVPFPPFWQAEVSKAKLKTAAASGKVVAELTFGFWVELTSRPNQNILWLGHGLRNAFPNATLPRDQIHARLKTIQRLRNRISHHERVLTSKNVLYAGFDFITPAQLVQCVEWTCVDTALWMKAQHRYSETGRLLSEVRAMNISL
jgi:hypothetical protein